MNIESQLKDERFEKQIKFLIEIDKIKNVIRKTRNFDNKKYENDAEHGWHLCMFALILSEYSNEPLDLFKVIKMALIHDIVEIDAGDVIVYAIDEKEKREKEKEAAERIFGILPEDQKTECISLWEEFETRETAEAKFAHSIDRLEPVIQNYLDDGHTWKKHGITSDKIIKVNKKIENGSITLWNFVRGLIEDSIQKGNLKNQ